MTITYSSCILGAMNDSQEILTQLKELGDPQRLIHMARFGVIPQNALGMKIPTIRRLAKGIKKNHQLALELWVSKIYEARILASLLDIPAEVTKKQMDEWASDFDTWEVCDQVCGNLFDRTPFAYEKAKTWSTDKREFVKRAGFVMMAELAVHDKKAADDVFIEFFPYIIAGSDDDRNFVKKAVNWAIRQIGKRNLTLLPKAITLAEELERRDSKPSHWIAKDALRELRSRQSHS